MSEKGGQARLNLRHQAISMIRAGKTCMEVGKALAVDRSLVLRWWKKYDGGGSLEDWSRTSTPMVQTKISKMILAKSLLKKRQSTRNLYKRLSRNGHKMCHMTVQNYLVKNLGAKAFKRWKIPKLTKKHVERRLKLCKDRLKCTTEDWKKVIWSNKIPY